jgi:hypothetical protein
MPDDNVEEVLAKLRPSYLNLYDETYFTGDLAVSGYDDYDRCRVLMHAWADMLDCRFSPISVLDVGAAYGFVVEWFRQCGVRAEGIEPSAWARAHAAVPLLNGYLPYLPTNECFDLVTATEVLEHVQPSDVLTSLRALATRVAYGGALVLLVLYEDGATAHDDAGHLTLRSRDWWVERLDATGLEHDVDSEQWLSEHTQSVEMLWSGRFLVYRRA